MRYSALLLCAPLLLAACDDAVPPQPTPTATAAAPTKGTAMTTTTTGAESIRWDLSPLYAGLDDPNLDRDITDWCGKAEAFQTAHKDRLATTLGSAITAYADLETRGSKIIAYLHLRSAVATGDAAVSAKLEEAKVRVQSAAGERLAFLEIEIASLDDASLDALMRQDEVVRRHRPWIEKIRQRKPHLLSEAVEGALVKRANFGSGAWATFFDEVEADLRFPWEGGTKTLTEMLQILNEDPDGERRAAALKAVNGGFDGPFAKYSAQALYMIAGEKSVEDRERGYRHPMDERNRENRISDEAVDALHRSVTEVAGPMARQYYRLKAAHLGLKTLRWSDRNAPMPFSDTSIVPWTEAVAIVQAAYASFSPTLAALVKQMIDEQRIDAPAVPGKRGGAFNSSFCLPDGTTIAYTLLNYQGSAGDVMTLAHELGHGVHGLLAGQAQGPLMMDAAIPYAETASVFGEMTTYVHLKERLEADGNKAAQLALVMSKLDDMMNTIVRQIGFSNFERRLHGWDPKTGTWKKAGKLSAEELDRIWLETTYELYGPPGEVFTYENTEHLWAYVSHFHRPYYVYGYSFADVNAASIYARKGSYGDRFDPLVVEMLRAGNTKDAKALLAPLDLDPSDPDYFAAGIRVGMGALLEEAEALSKDMGVQP